VNNREQPYQQQKGYAHVEGTSDDGQFEDKHVFVNLHTASILPPRERALKDRIAGGKGAYQQ